MPAMLEDPTAPVIYRTSGAPPYPSPSNPQIPPTIVPRQVTLRDRITIATLIPFSSPSHVPPSLLNYLCSQLNLEIEKGDTYPMMMAMPVSSFGAYWFQNFAAVMLLGEIGSVEDVVRMDRRRTNWEKVCLGSFYVKPNYPGRSSHVCNGGFLVTDAARNRGVGRLMGEGYLEWAPKLGYTYSVFNLVYETNLASCRIWDALGFKRIGRVKAAGNLRSSPDELVDAIIYGRDLGPEGEDFVSEERFDKIRFYLKHGKYPNGADRAEKSRLRSAATHYKLIEDKDGKGEERLMLKDKEVVSDPQRQYEIARQKHAEQHGGINKTTAAIAEMYHWVRIKETVSMAIKNCPECKDATKIPTVRPVSDGLSPSPSNMDVRPQRRSQTHHKQQQQHNQHNINQGMNDNQDPNALIERLVNFDDHDTPTSYTPSPHPSQHQLSHPHQPQPQHQNIYQPTPAPVASMQALQTQLQGQLQQELHGYSSTPHSHGGLPLDPQIMSHTHPDMDQGHQYQLQHEEQKYEQQQALAGGYQHHTEDGQYELDMSDLQDGGGVQGGLIDMQDADGVGGAGGVGEHGVGGVNHHEIGAQGVGSTGGDDTRLATARHVTHHDQPMAFVHEGHEDEREGRNRKEVDDDLFGEGKGF